MHPGAAQTPTHYSKLYLRRRNYPSGQLRESISLGGNHIIADNLASDNGDFVPGSGLSAADESMSLSSSALAAIHGGHYEGEITVFQPSVCASQVGV